MASIISMFRGNRISVFFLSPWKLLPTVTDHTLWRKRERLLRFNPPKLQTTRNVQSKLVQTWSLWSKCVSFQGKRQIYTFSLFTVFRNKTECMESVQLKNITTVEYGTIMFPDNKIKSTTTDTAIVHWKAQFMVWMWQITLKKWWSIPFKLILVLEGFPQTIITLEIDIGTLASAELKWVRQLQLDEIKTSVR